LARIAALPTLAGILHMEPLVTELLPLMTYCLVMSSTPGPNNVMLTASGANFGYRETLPQILGINLGGFVQTYLCCLGLGTLITQWPAAQTLLRVAGALYLLVLAWKLAGGSVGEARLQRPVSFAQSAIFQAVNPKTWIKAITLASVFMPAGMSAPVGALVVSVIGAVIGIPCVSMWALFGVAIRHLLSDPRKQRAFNLAMGATLVVLALMFLR
jgi:threonine/homoserine/homoserine lactone efflux protein